MLSLLYQLKDYYQIKSPMETFKIYFVANNIPTPRANRTFLAGSQKYIMFIFLIDKFCIYLLIRLKITAQSLSICSILKMFQEYYYNLKSSPIFFL